MDEVCHNRKTKTYGRKKERSLLNIASMYATTQTIMMRIIGDRSCNMRAYRNQSRVRIHHFVRAIVLLEQAA